MLACAHAPVTQAAEVSVNPSRHRMHKGIFHPRVCDMRMAIHVHGANRSMHSMTATLAGSCAGGRRRKSRGTH